MNNCLIISIYVIKETNTKKKKKNTLITPIPVLVERLPAELEGWRGRQRARPLV